MLFCKVLGAVLCLGAGGALGMLAVAYERARLRQAKGFLLLATRIREEISGFARPLHRIFAEVDATVWRDCGFGMRPVDPRQLQESTKLLLPADLCRELTSFIRRLGQGTVEEQLRSCDLFLTRLGPYCQKESENRRAREKATFLLPIFAAALLVLCLI